MLSPSSSETAIKHREAGYMKGLKQNHAGDTALLCLALGYQTTIELFQVEVAAIKVALNCFGVQLLQRGEHSFR